MCGGLVTWSSTSVKEKGLICGGSIRGGAYRRRNTVLLGAFI